MCVCNMVEKNIRNYIQYFIHLVLFPYVYFCELYVLCVLLSYYVGLLYLMCICCTLCLLYYVRIVTLDAGRLARSQNPEGPATGHLDTGFSWFPCVYKRMLRWFPGFQVATTCLSCSPTDLHFLVTFCLCLSTCQMTTATG